MPDAFNLALAVLGPVQLQRLLPTLPGPFAMAVGLGVAVAEAPQAQRVWRC